MKTKFFQALLAVGLLFSIPNIANAVVNYDCDVILGIYVSKPGGFDCNPGSTECTCGCKITCTDVYNGSNILSVHVFDVNNNATSISAYSGNDSGSGFSYTPGQWSGSWSGGIPFSHFTME